MIPQGQQSGGDATQERKDANVIGLLMVAGLLLLIVGVSFLVCWGILGRLQQEQEAHQPKPGPPVAAQVAAFPPPRLLVYPGKERERLQVTGQKQLETYGWIDRSSGIARIPIARAMQLIVERGLPEVGAGRTRLQLMQSRAQTDGQSNQPVAAPPPQATP